MCKVGIQRLIDKAPSSWLKMFKRYKLGRKPTVDQLIETVLEYTPTMRSSGARGVAKHKVPKTVKKEAMDGLKLAHKHNWTSASGVGLVRAMQLVARPKIWDRSVERMNSYFTRHATDKESNAIKSGKQTWGPRKPSRGYIAHLVWGGDSGQKWASRQVMKTNPIVSKRTLTNPKNSFALVHNKTREKLGLTMLFKKPLTKKESRIVQVVQYTIVNDLPKECKQCAEREERYAKQRKTQPLAGRCSLATQAVWKLLGGLNKGDPKYLPLVIRAGIMGNNSDTHWFIIRLSDGKIIDPTSAQFGRKRIPYEKGEWNVGLLSQHLRKSNGTSQLMKEQGIWTPPLCTRKLLEKISMKRNPSIRMVPKEEVRIVGFTNYKTKQVQKEIPYILGFIEEMRGEKMLFPTPIRAMTDAEFSRGRNVVDNGHPMGAGHGQINMNTNEIAINPSMGVKDLVANVFHENLHYAFPDWPEESVRDMTGEAMLNLYGEYILGRPFAEERKKNPQDYFMDHRPASPEYGGPLHDLTQIYPDDIYGPNGRRYYGTGMGDDSKEWQVVKRTKGKPDAPVRIYRSIPASVRANRQKIFKGDWVALNINYVLEHAEGGFGDDGDEYLVLSALVPASTLWTEGNSIQEWGYWPKEGSAEDQLGYAGVGTKFSILSPTQIRKFANQRNNPKRRRNRKAGTRDSKGRFIPARYLSGYKGQKLKARIAEIEQRRDEYQAALDKYGDEDQFTQKVLRKLYRPFETDKGVKSKRSKYTQEAKKRGFVGSVDEKAKLASKYYGGYIDPEILDEVNARGKAAWVSGGHRGGQTPFSWGIARVNSFLVGGKTFWTSDADLVRQLPDNVALAIAEKSILSPTLAVILS